MLTNGTSTSRFCAVRKVSEMGKDLYLYISLDKVDTAVPTRANLLLPFVLNVLLGWKSVYENGWQWNTWSWGEGKCFRFETATILRFKYELYLCRYFMYSLTCSNATITFLSRGFSSTPLKSHSIDENWCCRNIVDKPIHKAVVSARPLYPKMYNIFAGFKSSGMWLCAAG
jgi:hypothetical protein